MAKAYFMGLDTGTFESKGVIIDGECEVIATHAVAHGMENPKPGFFEHDADAVWWHDLCEISNWLLNESGIDPARILSVGCSTLGADCVPVDRNCKPLRRAILYGIDARATAEMAWLADYFGEDRINEWFGRSLCSSDVMPKILWLRNNEPEVYRQTHKFLTGSSFIAAKLTGNFTVDRFLGLASFNPLYHADGTPDPETCIPICRTDQLADVRSTIDIAGYVTAQAALETGLARGTPVIVGTDDSGAEAISAGVLQPGDMMLQVGSSVYMILCTPELVNDDRIWREEFIIPGTFDVSAGTNAAGTLTRWYRDTVFTDCLTASREAHGVNAYEAMMEGIDEIPPGSDGLITLPYFAGERTPINDPLAKGVLFGLKLSHTRRHMYRSALEGVGYSINQHFKVFAENRLAINKIMVVGGGTKNPQWMQIIADISGNTMTMPAVTIGASFGDAMMAAMGIRYFASFAELGATIRPGATFVPSGANHEKYGHYQSVFDELYPATRELMRRL
jgi:xylulokinase